MFRGKKINFGTFKAESLFQNLTLYFKDLQTVALGNSVVTKGDRRGTWKDLQCKKHCSDVLVISSAVIRNGKMSLSLFPMSASPFLPYRWAPQYYFSRFHIYICITIQYLYFSFWLTSVCITGSRFIHLSSTDSNSFFDHLEGWDGKGTGGSRGRGYIYIYIYITVTDSCCCKAETNTTL